MKRDLIYKYSYGSEAIPSAAIIIYKLASNTYEIRFDQESSTENFDDITINPQFKLVSKSVDHYTTEYLSGQQVIIILEAPLNPPPETLFKIGG